MKMIAFPPLAVFLTVISTLGGTATALKPPIAGAPSAAADALAPFDAPPAPIAPADRTRAVRSHARGRRSYRHSHSWHTEHHSHSEHHSSSHYRGRATWYAVGQGACGAMSSPHEHIVALNKPQYEAQGYSVSSGACFRSVLITNEKNGKTATAKVVDMCEGCEHGSLDMSPGIFQAMADGGLGEGTFDISWVWNDGGDDDGDDDDDNDS